MFLQHLEKYRCENILLSECILHDCNIFEMCGHAFNDNCDDGVAVIYTGKSVVWHQRSVWTKTAFAAITSSMAVEVLAETMQFWWLLLQNFGHACILGYSLCMVWEFEVSFVSRQWILSLQRFTVFTREMCCGQWKSVYQPISKAFALSNFTFSPSVLTDDHTKHKMALHLFMRLRKTCTYNLIICLLQSDTDWRCVLFQLCYGWQHLGPPMWWIL